MPGLQKGQVIGMAVKTTVDDERFSRLEDLNKGVDLLNHYWEMAKIVDPVITDGERRPV